MRMGVGWLMVLGCGQPAPVPQSLQALEVLQDPGASVVSVLEHGATSADVNDDDDDAVAFHAALTELRELDAPRVLVVPAGAFDLENHDNRKRGWLIDVSHLTVACEPGAVLRGDPTPGDHLDPPEDWTSKKAIAIQPPVGSSIVEDVEVVGCAVEFPRAHSANEQAHAIAIQGELPDRWARDVTLRNLHIGPIGSGDGIYAGIMAEGITVADVEVRDPARSGFAVGGNGGAYEPRFGFHVAGLGVAWDGYNPAQEDAAAIDFEPNKFEARIADVTVSQLRSTEGQLHVEKVNGGSFDDIAVGWLVLSEVDGAKFTNHRQLPCQPGDGAGGAGWCVSSMRPPVVASAQGAFEVHPDGGGMVSAIDYRQDGRFDGTQQDYWIKLEGPVVLNGGAKVRDDVNNLLTDPLRVDVAGLEER